MGLLLDLLNCGVLLTGIRAASPGPRSLTIGAVLIIADLTSHWTSVLIPDRASFFLHYSLTLAILAFTTSTILTAMVLYQYGTGPVKGFAVTLIAGIVASMITSIFVVRTFYLLWLNRSRGAQTLSI